MNLFSQSLVIFCAAVAFVAATSYIWLARTDKDFIKKLFMALGIALIALIASYVTVNRLFTLQNIPSSAFFIFFLTAALAVLTGLGFRSGWPKLGLGAGAVVMFIVLEAIIVNDFYFYYPTVASIFNKPQTITNLREVVIGAKNVSKSQNEASLEARLLSSHAFKGEVYSVNIPGTVSHFKARDAVVYLPPAYLNNVSPSLRFPVLVMLNGTPGSPDDWLHGGQLETTANNFSTRHDGVTPIIIVPDHSGSFTGDTECVNSSRGNAETYLTIDVPNFIKQHFRVSSNANNWGIGGFSEGGMCAAMLTLRHQNIFEHFLDMGGESGPDIGIDSSSKSTTIKELFGGSTKIYDQHNIDWLLANVHLSKNLTGQLVIGDDDNKSLVAQFRSTFAQAHSRGLSASLELIPHGGHTFAVWSQGFKDSLPRLSYDLGATSCKSGCFQSRSY